MADVTIKVSKDGPYQIVGDITLIDHEGNAIPTTPEQRIKLCRCGGSVNKPFCDGTHSKIGFIGARKAVADAEGAK